MRIGIVGIQHESNTFLAQPTTGDDFRKSGVYRGEDLRAHLEDGHHEISGAFAELHEANAIVIPWFFAWAVPGGAIDTPTADWLLEELVASLSDAETMDGVFVAPHGAAVSSKYADFDGHWLSLVRDIVGPDVPIVGTLDPHANLSRRMVEATNALVAYRTNPHLDQRAIGRRAARLLCQSVRGDVRLAQAAAWPNVAINIQSQRTAVSPCRELYAYADEQANHNRILSNSVLLGFPYADVPEMGSACLSIADADIELAHLHAEQVASYLYRHRDAFGGELMEVELALRHARDSAKPVCLLDMGDNVGGGSPGDGTVLLEALIRHEVANCFVCLYDPESVSQAEKVGVKGKVRLAVGGKTDDWHGPPVSVSAVVAGLYPGQFRETEARHGGRTDYDMGRTAVLTTDVGQTIMLTSRRIMPVSLSQLTSCHLDPMDYDVIVAKGVHAPLGAYESVCRTFLYVDTPGVTTADMRRLSYNNRPIPLFPFEYDPRS